MTITKSDMSAFLDTLVEIPPIERNRHTIYGFECLEKHNDLHVIPQCGDRKKLCKIRQAAYKYAREKGFKIITRTYDCALFIWRIDYGREDEVVYLEKTWTER